MNINYALVSAFERSKKQEKKKPASRLFAALLMGVFFIALIGGLAAGASIYSSIVEVQSHTGDVQMQSGLLANSVHANDSVLAVKRGEGPEGEALVLVESLPTGTFETRIYLYQGTVVQEYSFASREYNPEKATPLFASNTFEFSFDGELITLTTDQGTLDVALRSKQEAVT